MEVVVSVSNSSFTGSSSVSQMKFCLKINIISDFLYLYKRYSSFDLPFATTRILPFEIELPSESYAIFIWTDSITFHKLFETYNTLISSVDISKELSI